MPVVYILLCAIIFQLAAAVLAIRLIRITGKSTAWILISTALIFMTVRHAIPLYHILTGDVSVSLDPINEFIGLVLSFLMMVGVAKIAPLFIEIKKSEMALTVSEIRYRRLFESAKDGILILDGETGKIIDANPFLLAILDYSQEEIIGRELWEIGPFKDIIANRDTFRKLQLQEYVRYEHLLLQNKNCVTVHVEFLSNFYFMNERKVIQCNIRDITERKRAESEILKLNRIYAVLSNINQLLVREHDRQKLFEDVCKIAIEDGEFQMSWIGILNSNGGTIEPVAHAGLVDGYLEILHSAVTDAHDGEDPIGIALREGRYATCNDIAQDHRETLWREKALALGYKSMAAFPLCLANKAIGVISFYSNELGFFDSKEVQLIEELAMDISFALESLQTEEQRKRAETALRESNDFNELMLQTMPHGMNIVDEQGNILFVNNTMKSLLNTDAIGKHCWTIYKDDKSQCPDCPLHKGIESRDNRIFEVSGVLGGKTFQISYIGMLYRGKRSMLEVFQDITEQKRLQLELLQSHKMQSIGTLAGGIAHDFNNILGIILGYTSLLEKRRSDGEKHSEGIAIINQAVQRGAALVRQILTFARKTDIEFEPFDIVDLIHELISMFRQTFPKIITFTENIEKNIPYLYADRTQIHQALMNLCVNARDAMPNGGSINIDVKVFSLELMHKKFPTADQNSYMCITVSDTGQGMDEAMRLRVFDPFFTTKEKGKGTGMGLSVVYGVVKAHRGYIELESALGQGTTFSLYIPIPIISTQAVKSEQPPESVDIGGTETILIVEDEELLVHLLQLMLESKGYKVYVAQDGLKAIEIYKQHREEIKLVLTDMGLPEMTGMDEFKKLKRIDPNVKIVFASGFFNPDTKSELLQTGAKGFIQKPYEANEILKTIRKVLDQKGS